MSCLISSEFIEQPVDLWNYIDYSKCDEITEYSDIKDKNIKVNFGNGCFVNINNVIYVITCFHVIEHNNTKIFAHVNGKEIPLKVIRVIEELDIAILSCDEIICEYYTFDQFMTRICDISEIEEGYNINAYVDSMTNVNISAKLHSIEECNAISDYIDGYYIPYLNFEVGSLEKILSGGLVTYNKNPIGMIMSYDIETKLIKVLPAVILINIINSNLNKKKQDIHAVIANFVFKEDTYIVTEDYQIDDKLKINDMIISVDNKKCTQDGIYDEIIGYTFHIKSYIFVRLLFSINVHVKYIRNGRIRQDMISGISINKNISINTKNTNMLLYYNGFVFCELSNSILKYLQLNDIIIPCIKLINTKKCVALIHVDYDYLKKNDNKEYHKMASLNLPYPNGELLVLNKIGNDYVLNLESLKHILYKKLYNQKVTYHFNNNKYVIEKWMPRIISYYNKLYREILLDHVRLCY